MIFTEQIEYENNIETIPISILVGALKRGIPPSVEGKKISYLEHIAESIKKYVSKDNYDEKVECAHMYGVIVVDNKTILMNMIQIANFSMNLYNTVTRGIREHGIVHQEYLTKVIREDTRTKDFNFAKKWRAYLLPDGIDIEKILKSPSKMYWPYKTWKK